MKIDKEKKNKKKNKLKYEIIFQEKTLEYENKFIIL